MGIETGTEPATSLPSHNANATASAPATFYGWVSTTDAAVGSQISAWIGDQVCGTTEVITVNGWQGYAISVESENVVSPNGCGLLGATVTFKLDGVTVETAVWDNSRANHLNLGAMDGIPMAVVGDAAVVVERYALLYWVVAVLFVGMAVVTGNVVSD